MLSALPTNRNLTSRWVKDAMQYDAPFERKPGAKGCPRVRGAKRPTPTNKPPSTTNSSRPTAAGPVALLRVGTRITV